MSQKEIQEFYILALKYGFLVPIEYEEMSEKVFL